MSPEISTERLLTEEQLAVFDTLASLKAHNIETQQTRTFARLMGGAENVDEGQHMLGEVWATMNVDNLKTVGLKPNILDAPTGSFLTLRKFTTFGIRSANQGIGTVECQIDDVETFVGFLDELNGVEFGQQHSKDLEKVLLDIGVQLLNASYQGAPDLEGYRSILDAYRHLDLRTSDAKTIVRFKRLIDAVENGYRSEYLIVGDVGYDPDNFDSAKFVIWNGLTYYPGIRNYRVNSAEMFGERLGIPLTLLEAIMTNPNAQQLAVTYAEHLSQIYSEASTKVIQAILEDMESTEYYVVGDADIYDLLATDYREQIVIANKRLMEIKARLLIT